MNVARKKILFPTDFSAAAEAALELAASLARDRGATLLVVHVEELPLAYGGGEMYGGLPGPTSHDLYEMLTRVVPRDASVEVEHRLTAGDPAAAIVRLAEDEPIDMIVMGTHGRRGVPRLLMGSVAEAVLRGAPCPVLTCKTPATVEVSSR